MSILSYIPKCPENNTAYEITISCAYINNEEYLSIRQAFGSCGLISSVLRLLLVHFGPFFSCVGEFWITLQGKS